MIAIESYIIRPGTKLYSFEDAIAHSDEYFISIEDEERLVPLHRDYDGSYLYGFIQMMYWDEVLLDFPIYGLIDCWWINILEMTRGVLDHGVGENHIPELGIRMELKYVGRDQIVFALGGPYHERTGLPRKEFLQAVVAGAEHFFDRMTTCWPGHGTFAQGLSVARELTPRLPY